MSHPKFVASARESTGLWTVISQFDDRSFAIAVFFRALLVVIEGGARAELAPSATRGGLFLAQRTADMYHTVIFLSDIRSEGTLGT